VSVSLVPSAPREHQLGFWMCTALVVGNMIGASVFLLPASLAPYGLNSVVAWLVTATGALFIAAICAALGRAFPTACGAYDYSRIAFGELAGFVVAWGYWISIWVSNAAIATGSVSYLSDFFPAIATQPTSALVTIAGIWLLTGVNIYGTRAAGSVQMVTTALKIVPLVAIAGLGVFLFIAGDPTLTQAPRAPTHFGIDAITAAATLTLFSFLGLESATIPAGKVIDPARTIPRATLIGTLVTAVIYVLATTSVLLLMPSATLAQSHAPFADVARLFWGDKTAAWIAGFAVISGVGALNGWILLQGELPFHMAKQGTFPAVFAQESKRHTPVVSLCIGSALTSVLLMMNSAKAMVDVFSFMVLLGTAACLIMYLLCALAVLRLLKRGELPGSGPRARQAWLAIVAVVAMVYSLWAIYGAGLNTDANACGGELVCWMPWLSNPAILGILLTLSGVPVFYLMPRASAKPATA
jgi:APA family basic amino acid/polyamine antiporter